RPSARSRSRRRSSRPGSFSRGQEACSNMPAESMTDQQFHEIPLREKQLVFVFMSAVVVAVVIFLLGVSVGRGVRGSLPAGAVADAGATSDTVVPAAPPA